VSFLQLCTIPLGILSKAPQILENHNNRSTGNLSAFAVFSALLGCLARLFTTKQEVKDPLVFWGFAGAALLNLVLALQMIVYWKASDEPSLASRKIPCRHPCRQSDQN
jgi:mannose-P-dolichol utilization defect protein 1